MDKFTSFFASFHKTTNADHSPAPEHTIGAPSSVSGKGEPHTPHITYGIIFAMSRDTDQAYVTTKNSHDQDSMDDRDPPVIL